MCGRVFQAALLGHDGILQTFGEPNVYPVLKSLFKDEHDKDLCMQISSNVKSDSDLLLGGDGPAGSLCSLELRAD